MPIIDVHSHYVPRDLPVLTASSGIWNGRGARVDEDGNLVMHVSGCGRRSYSRAVWDLRQRIDFLDREGIIFQFVSPPPDLLSAVSEPGAAAAFATGLNEGIAAAVSAAPERLGGLGLVPLACPDAACDVLRTAHACGLSGVLVPSNAAGESIASLRFDALWAEADRLGMVVYIHGHGGAGGERFLGPAVMAPVVGVPQDCAASVASFISTDILGRHAGLKLVFAHGGGMFGAIVDRFDYVWSTSDALRAAVPMSPRLYASRFHYDTVTFGDGYLAYLVSTYGSRALLHGTDGIATGGVDAARKRAQAVCAGDDAAAADILWKNAARLFNMERQLTA